MLPSGNVMEIWRLKYWTHRRGHGKKNRREKVKKGKGESVGKGKKKGKRKRKGDEMGKRK